MIRRGDIFFVDLEPVQGRDLGGRRPVLVVSANSINCQPLVITVVPGTDSARVPRDHPVNVRVSAAESGLPRDTLFLGFQLRSLDPARFPEDRAGRMPPERMSEMDEALKRVLALG